MKTSRACLPLLILLTLSLSAPDGSASSHGDGEPQKTASGKGDAPTPGPATAGPIYKPPESLGVPFGRTGGGVRSAKPTYVPPTDVDAPGGRTPGGTRGDPPTTCSVPKLQVLAPRDHPGRTLSKSPSLFWFSSEIPAPCAAGGFRFTMIADDEAEPFVEQQLPAPTGAGVQRIDLADYGQELEPGRHYHWWIVFLTGGTDIRPAAGAPIRRIVKSAELDEALSNPDGAMTVHAYAREGLWYDALAAIADRIAATPDDARLRAWWSSLLEAEGLQDLELAERM